MARRLTPDESQNVWSELESSLSGFGGGPKELPPDDGTYQFNLNAYPSLFPARAVVTGVWPPDDGMLSAIREGMDRLGETTVYFIAKQFVEGEQAKGLDWELSSEDLSGQQLAEINPGLECYLGSTEGRWAIYFHHEGFAFCGGVPAFVDAVRERCTPHALDQQ
jgi:hypothetical protein